MYFPIDERIITAVNLIVTLITYEYQGSVDATVELQDITEYFAANGLRLDLGSYLNPAVSLCKKEAAEIATQIDTE